MSARVTPSDRSPPAAGAAPAPGALASALRVAACAFALVFLEWLFFVTKPSFLDEATPGARFAALWVASFPLVAASLALHACLLALGRGVGRLRLPGSHRAEAVAAALTPAILLTATSLLLIDNFTYTVFGWGLVSIGGAVLLLPIAGLLLLFWSFLRRSLRARPLLSLRLPLAASACWLGATALALGWLVFAEGREVSGLAELQGDFDRAALPNILIFGADGVESDRMSAYGYERETTPNLDRFLDRAWVFENAFTNASRTTGALTALMTGRLPTTTKVIFPPQTLHGSDAYLNLPGILRQLGYRGVQETVRHYADGRDLNWKESFDVANGRRLRWTPASRFTIAIDTPARLAGEIQNRIGDRVRHLLGIQPMPNVFREVTSPDPPTTQGFLSDVQRIDRVLRFIDDPDPRPFFAHIHLLETHCCRFRPANRVFSDVEGMSGEALREASYDDTILGTDAAFGRLMDFLEERDLLKNTVVVYLSDHTRQWGIKDRLPLVFLFPDGRKAGRETKAAQSLDVAPTLLDYLGLPVPSWMEGVSLLGDIPPDRPIFSSAQARLEKFKSRKGKNRSWMPEAGPPWFGLGQLGMVRCQRWYTFDLAKGELRSGDMGGYVAPCPEEELPTDGQAAAWMSRHLEERGFSFAPWHGGRVAEN